MRRRWSGDHNALGSTRRALAITVLCGVVACSACGSPNQTALAPPPEPRRVVGVIFDDANADGTVDTDERPIEGSRVTVSNPLTGGTTEHVTSGDGTFAIDTSALADVRVEVETDLPPASGSDTAVQLYVTRAVPTGESVSIGITRRGRCSTFASCDFLLPDLTPVLQTPAFLNSEIQSEYPGTNQWTIERAPDGRRLLRLATSTANIGEGPLLILGTGNRDGKLTSTVQRLVSPTLQWIDVPSGEFSYSDSHDHVHLAAYTSMVLKAGDKTVAKNDKVSFCLTDVFPARENGVPPIVSAELKLFDCGVEMQGINAGMIDYYGPALPDQFIDITDLAPGTYTLEIVVDPQGVLTESNETNNSATLEVTIP